ncbi:MAG: nitrile hydratase subunit beta [Alphaproteobacteria bacterium]|nr:nitrile hydratase subunit beta [Alphaproteobacteria bacterium]
MDGIHDMGGMDGFGPIPIEQNEPVFHADWEGRLYAINSVTGAWGRWNIDAGRACMERLAPAVYLQSPYYHRWLYRMENLLVERDMVTRAELDTGKAAGAPVEPLATEEVFERLRASRSARVDDSVAPKFKVGDTVLVRNIHPKGHTRTPRYARGRRGVIDRDHGVFIFPDTHAEFKGEAPQHLYSVRFTARELWGPDAAESDTVYLDMWDDYLEAC